MAVEFVTAPPPVTIGKRPKRPKHYAIARKLIENPGQWAIIMRDASTAMPHQIKNGGLKAFEPAGAFEAVARTNGKKNRATIYARYVKDLPQESDTMSLGVSGDE